MGSTNCCRRVRGCAHGLTRDRVHEIMHFVRLGVEEFRDKLPAVQMWSGFAYARQIGDARLLGLYHKLYMLDSTPAPNVSGEGQSMYNNVIIDNAEHPLWGVIVGLDGINIWKISALALGVAKSPTNHRCHLIGPDAVSRSTLSKVWTPNWKQCITLKKGEWEAVQGLCSVGCRAVVCCQS